VFLGRDRVFLGRDRAGRAALPPGMAANGLASVPALATRARIAFSMNR